MVVRPPSPQVSGDLLSHRKPLLFNIQPLAIDPGLWPCSQQCGIMGCVREKLDPRLRKAYDLFLLIWLKVTTPSNTPIRSKKDDKCCLLKQLFLISSPTFCCPLWTLCTCYAGSHLALFLQSWRRSVTAAPPGVYIHTGRVYCSTTYSTGESEQNGHFTTKSTNTKRVIVEK